MNVESMDGYRQGEEVTEAGAYVGKVCRSEAASMTVVLDQGDKFPECLNCGDDSYWHKSG